MNVGRHLFYLEDKHGRFTVKDISTGELSSGFIPAQKDSPHFGITDSTYWLRFSICNPQDSQIQYLLMLDYPLIDDIELYVPESRGAFTVRRAGDRYPFYQREFDYSSFVFPIKQEPGTYTYYMRVKTSSSMALPVSILSKEYLYRDIAFEFGINGLYYGILLVMLLYNLFIYFSMRERSYLLYVIYIAGFFMASLCLDGLGFQYIWSDFPIFTTSSIFMISVNIMFIFFSRDFIHSKGNAPVLDRIILGWILFGLVILTMHIRYHSDFIGVSIIYTLITLCIVMTTVFVTLFRGVRSAIFYLTSWSVFVVGVVIYCLRSIGILPLNMFTASIFKFSAALQFILFSFGLADRINSMKKELEILNLDLEEEIKEHRKDKAALMKSEERFRGVVERNFDVIYTLDKRGHYTYASPSARPAYGYEPEELCCRHFNDLLTADVVGSAEEAIREVTRGREIIGFQAKAKKKDGGVIYLEINMSPIKTGGVIVGVQGIARDITERKMAQEDLLAEKERLSVTLTSIAEGVIATDIRWKIQLMNRAAEELSGWESGDAIGRSINDVIILKDGRTGERKSYSAKEARGGGKKDILKPNTILVSREMTEKIISDSIAPIRDLRGKIIGHVVVIRDVTDEIKLHQERLKLEKLESIGILAGGIAHDFNNILTAIIGNINLAKLTVRDDGRLTEILSDAEKASTRAKELTHQFLTFSKGGAPVKQIASIEDIIGDSSRFVLRGSNVKCSLRFQDKLWPVNLDIGQFSQVIQNLVINADQAMPRGGEVVISTENIVVHHGDFYPIKPGNYVRIVITDTGCGIKPEDLPKIFDPYFTTKDRGNGLGLASSYSIIKNHDGYIFAESEVGVGTAFSIYLPSSEGGKGEEEKKAGELLRGKGRILIMDDDEGVVIIARRMLEHLGFDVEIARDGESSLNLFKDAQEKGRPFACVILDLTIPGGMGGEKTLEEMKKIDSNVKAIVSSGYSHDLIMANYEKFGFRGVIAKPYRLEELSSVIEGVIHCADN